jgi:hypothetical protein
VDRDQAGTSGLVLDPQRIAEGSQGIADDAVDEHRAGVDRYTADVARVGATTNAVPGLEHDDVEPRAV